MPSSLSKSFPFDDSVSPLRLRVDRRANRSVKNNTTGTLSTSNPIVNHDLPPPTRPSSHRPAQIASKIIAIARQPTFTVTDNKVTCHAFWGSLLFRTQITFWATFAEYITSGTERQNRSE